MKLDLKPVFLGEDEIKIDEEFDLSHSISADLAAFKHPVHVTANISNKTGIVTMKGIAKVSCITQCDRCLNDINEVFTVDLYHIFVKDLEQEDDGSFIVLPDMMLDVEMLIHDDILLQLPYQHLCNENCKGLCPKCGQNLNEGSCSCEEDIDPRLAVLQQLLKE